MKKTNLLQLLIIVFAMSFITSCEKHKCKCEHENENWEDQIPEGTFCYANLGKPGNLLKYQEIVEMLEAYDNTRKEVLKDTLGFEDTRVNTYPIESLRAYLGYMESLAEEKDIPLTGINMISAAYKKYDGKEPGYQSLIFMPTTTLNGEEYVTIDLVRSKKNDPVTFKTLLAKKKYHWPYDKSKVTINEQKAGVAAFQNDDSSGANKLQTSPPN